MKMKSISAHLSMRVCVAALVALPATAQEADPQRHSVASTRSLIEESTSAQQIDRSKVPKSLAMRDEARAWLKQAEAALASGNVAEMNQHLGAARKLMLAAVRLAGPAQVDGEKALRDYETRLVSVKALRDALQRLGGAKNSATITDADAYLAAAAQHASDRSFDLALVEVNKAYDVIKAGNVEQRDHTEQVVSKNFATKEDEYKYEIGRNDEYQQLSEAVLKNLAADRAASYTPVFAKAMAVRKDAQGQAGKGNFAAAVTAMETSTAEYKKIIRASGIPVP